MYVKFKLHHRLSSLEAVQPVGDSFYQFSLGHLPSPYQNSTLKCWKKLQSEGLQSPSPWLEWCVAPTDRLQIFSLSRMQAQDSRSVTFSASLVFSRASSSVVLPRVILRFLGVWEFCFNDASWWWWSSWNLSLHLLTRPTGRGSKEELEMLSYCFIS